MRLLSDILPWRRSEAREDAAFRRGMQQGARAYAAGQMNRLLSDFVVDLSHINRDIKANIAAVRARARDLSKNNPHVQRFINLCRHNIVGHLGFKLQMNVRELVDEEWQQDEPANMVIEEHWREFSKAVNCSVTGNMSMRQIQDLLASATPRDGEQFVRLVRRKEYKYGIALQIIEPELVDHNYNEILPDGHVIQMGIEFDAWRKPVAIHLTPTDISRETYMGSNVTVVKRERIPMEEIVHGFRRDFATQSRGMSWLAPGMVQIHMLAKYEEAVVTNARISAAKGIILTDKDGNTTELEGDDEDDEGNKIFEAEPGGMFDAGNKTVTQFTPEFPSAQHESFVGACLRAAASAWNVSYASLSNDLSQATYGSNRVGLLEEREGWKVAQSWFIETFLEPIFTAWLKEAMLKGAITINGKALPFAKFDKFNQPRFVGRRWGWIDPLKDIAAEIMAIEAGLKTATESLAERGEDIIELWKELGAEKKLAEKHGLTLSINKLGLEYAMTDEKKARRLLDTIHGILAEDARYEEVAGSGNQNNGKGRS